MVNFNENELTRILKDFDDKSKIELGFEKGIEGKFEVEDASIGYDYKNGFIFIKGANCDLKINTAMVCGYEKNENEIRVDLEDVMVKFFI